MARPRCARWISENDERESCINVRANMGIRAHPRLTNGKTSKGHIGTQSRGCAGQTVRPSLHSISQTSVGKLLNRPTVRFHFLYSLGSREAIPSEPPSLARPMRRAMVAEGGGGYPLGGPERAFVTRHLQQSSAGRPDLAIASMLRCSRFDACSIQGHRPRFAVLGRRTRTTCAACTNSVLMYLLPRLEILPRIVRSPVDSCYTADVYATTLCSLSKVLGIEPAAHTRRSFNSTNRELVRQQRRRRFYPRIFVSRI